LYPKTTENPHSHSTDLLSPRKVERRFARKAYPSISTRAAKMYKLGQCPVCRLAAGFQSPVSSLQSLVSSGVVTRAQDISVGYHAQVVSPVLACSNYWDSCQSTQSSHSRGLSCRSVHGPTTSGLTEYPVASKRVKKPDLESVVQPASQWMKQPITTTY
jgi:hypothetical protein